MSPMQWHHHHNSPGDCHYCRIEYIQCCWRSKGKVEGQFLSPLHPPLPRPFFALPLFFAPNNGHPMSHPLSRCRPPLHSIWSARMHNEVPCEKGKCNIQENYFHVVWLWDHFAIPTFRIEKYANVMYFSTLVFSVFKSWIFAEAVLHIPTRVDFELPGRNPTTEMT